MITDTSPLVLVVDDEPDFLEIMQARLESQGFRSITATDGVEAVEKAKEAKPAIILMDIEMPRRDGVAAAAELARDPETRYIPTIFVTNLDKETADSVAKRVSYSIGEHNYFPKDGDYLTLMRQIHTATAG